MSNFLRLLRTTRSNPLLTLRASRNSQTTRMSNYFHPSHSPFPSPRPSNIGLSRTRTRPYSNYSSSGNYWDANFRVLYGLMGVNIAVFGYATYTKAQAQSGYPGPIIKFMRHMTVNATDVLKNGQYYTLLTAAFTHTELWHLIGNMFTTYYLGGMLCYSPLITPGRLLTIALGAGVTGNVGFVWQRYLVAGDQGVDRVRGLGFSGALMGIVSMAACLAPKAKVAIYGIIPVPLWGLVVGYGLYDGYYLNNEDSRVGHSGHLGGLAFGIMYYLFKLRTLTF